VSAKHTFEYIDGITVVRFSEMPTFVDAKLIIDQLAKENSYHLRLWDFSRVKFDFTMDDIRTIAKYGKSKFLEKNFLAAVALQDVAYGTLRAFEVYREEEGRSSVRTFRTEQEAMDWLVSQRGHLDS